jgi:hypothetical protein
MKKARDDVANRGKEMKRFRLQVHERTTCSSIDERAQANKTLEGPASRCLEQAEKVGKEHHSHEDNEVLKRHIHCDYSTELRKVDHILEVLLYLGKLLNSHSFYELIKHHKPRKRDEKEAVFWHGNIVAARHMTYV